MNACASDRQLQEQIWSWLHQVSDPEIPVISVVDLGIVREVQLSAASGQEVHCTVVITPTYSGCPAMNVISREIIAVLQQHGISDVAIQTKLSPAWSTDWMSEHGKSQLKNYGIAPPAQQVIDISGISRKRSQAPKVACPHCGSLHTVCVSQFGSTSCKSLYQCKDCLEPFDYFKAH
ncbi:1,2-phenylacetyl-CoA epoxidase subunit PaaD [Herbaspirillum sp. RV1423]|uniref:1,2-phenylacetyl-CoA epoxidase subunit PaaD n=1 Tax=Herbaspirillum sp. RV1423 TaxID=1443993 RepID=UPI0004B8A2A8|nr:1,2-phenylacetyl-CoA epoxidase subunit PaaD [Herbaspirillum sp. RV1423]